MQKYKISFHRTRHVFHAVITVFTNHSTLMGLFKEEFFISLGLSLPPTQLLTPNCQLLPLSHRNHPEANQRGRGIVVFLAVNAGVVAGIEEAAAVGNSALIHHLRHIAAHIEKPETVGVKRIDLQWIAMAIIEIIIV